MKTRLQLEFVPPSVNHLYRWSRSKASGAIKCRKSEEYNTWSNAVGHFINRQKAGQPKWNEPVYLTVAIRRPEKARDLDNCQKAIGDLLQDHGVISNDTLIHGWNISWSDHLPQGVAVEIVVSPAASPFAREAEAA